MARIRNSMAPNIYGEGNEQILTTDNGEEYVIRNTMAPNLHGEGNEKEIVKRYSTNYSSGSFLEELAFIVITITVWGGSIIGLGALTLFIVNLLS